MRAPTDPHRRARQYKFKRHNDRYISENRSDMRGIKHGWYAIEDDGKLSSGPFPSLEACVTKISQPVNGTMALKLQEGPN